MKHVIVMAALLGTIAIPAQAQVAVRQDKTIRVSYQPSDLLTTEGRARLQRRVAAASYRVCRFDATTGMVLPSTDELNCRRVALANARKAADRAILAANQGVLVASANR